MSSSKKEIIDSEKADYGTKIYLKDVFCTAAEIKKVWDEEGWNKKNWTEDTIIRKFKKILKEIGLNDEIKWYQSISCNGRSEIFIFSGKKDAPQKIYKLFDIFYGSKGLIRKEEKQMVAEILTDILPIARSIDGLNKIQQKVQEIKENKSGSEFFLLNDINNSDAHKARITEAVDNYVPDMIEFFLDNILVDLSSTDIPSPKSRQEFCAFQYDAIKKWRDKWKSIMEYAAAIRIAERFENGYDVCRENEILKEDREVFYKEGNFNNQTLQEIKKNSDWIEKEDLYEALIAMQARGLLGKPQDEESIPQNAEKGSGIKKVWRDKYIELVNEIKNDQLEKISRQDFDYMQFWALEELYAVGCKVERKRRERIYCSELEDRSAEDLEKLSLIKEVIDNKKRTIFDISPL